MSNPVTNFYGFGVLSVTLSPALIVLNTSAEQTFTCPGLKTGDIVFVSKPTAQAGLAMFGFRVSANDTLAITFGNFTGSSITPTAGEAYLVFYARPERVLTAARA